MYNKEIDTTNNKPKSCIKELFKDKNGCYSLRELEAVLHLSISM
jgi:hypothetical protein